MISKSLKISALVVLVTLPMAKAQMAPQTQATLTQGSSGTWNLDWAGVANRTYFVQWSVDLVHWQYFPFMEFGDGLKSYGFSSSSDKFFVRLKYVDSPWLTSLADAEAADFDGDGIPNLYEVQTLGTDPLDPDSNGGDSDHNGLPDGWELYYFGSLGIADPNAKLFPDGLTNKEKSQLGLSPTGDDLSSGTQRISYSYDGPNLGSANFYTQRELGYTLDGNGNIQIATSH